MKRASKDADVWTPADVAAAAEQGWELLEFWDLGKQRFGWQIFRHGEKFVSDALARTHVLMATAQNSARACKAQRIIIQSKLGEQHGRRKKN